MRNVSRFFDHMLILMNYKNPSVHNHLAKHLIFSLEDSFYCIINNVRFECSGICINSNVTHTIQTKNVGILVLLFDKTSNFSSELDKLYLQGKDYVIMNKDIINEVREAYLRFKDDYEKLDNEIINICNINNKKKTTYDKRIIDVLNVISECEGIYKETFLRLREVSMLSESRLSHLFKNEVGVSLSSFLVYEKLRKTFLYIEEGENITSAAIRAGFNSSAHCAAVCKRMFGISFTEFLQNNRIASI